MEGTPDLDKLRDLAAHFREAIVNCDPAGLPGALRRFPKRACSDASLLLARYLADWGYGPADYVCGVWGDEAAHAWLQLGDIIIDITADQFHPLLKPVIVTRRSPWHQTFEEDMRCRADFALQPEAAPNLAIAYAQIIQHLAGAYRPREGGGK
ncbi:MAG: hypothetical protein PHU78_09640 [Heliobacteriaceae bacterium]|nr:hypothetical protein [Heliobacteriaceae bacterium]